MASINGVGTALLELAVAEGGEVNTVVSPTSVAHAVLMLRDAGDPATVSAVDAMFGFPAGLAAHEAWNALDHRIEAGNGTRRSSSGSGERTPTVTIAGRVWPALGSQPDPSWLALLASRHGIEVEPIDVERPEAVRQRVNDWVAEETEGIIRDLLPAGAVSRDTEMLVTDAVYFAAEWERSFTEHGPVDAWFVTLGGDPVTASFLVEFDLGAPRGVGDGWAAAELPYRGGDWSMLVVVPDAGTFAAFRSDFGPDVLAEIDAGLSTGPYELRVPVWSGSSKLDLLPWLREAGVAPGRYPDADHVLTGGLHAAHIEVDEYGTVAAAATALVVGPEAGPPEPEVRIVADRPFLFVIRHVDTGLILFQGQVVDPTLE